MAAIGYDSALLEERVETVRSLVNDLKVPTVVDAKDPAITAPVKDRIFLTHSHLLSTALLSFARNNGSYHLGQPAIPTVQGPYGIYVPAQEPEALIHRVKLGDERAFEALYDQYQGLIGFEISPYFAAGYERDDFIALGHLALFDAACCYNFSVGSPFPWFLKKVLRRQVITEIKTANRDKHSALNNSLSLDTFGHSDYDMEPSLGESVPEPATPFYEVDLGDWCHAMLDAIRRRLSPLEVGALELYIRGLSYAEIEETLRFDYKQIDNALQRAKKKVELMSFI